MDNTKFSKTNEFKNKEICKRLEEIDKQLPNKDCICVVTRKKKKAAFMISGISFLVAFMILKNDVLALTSYAALQTIAIFLFGVSLTIAYKTKEESKTLNSVKNVFYSLSLILSPIISLGAVLTLLISNVRIKSVLDRNQVVLLLKEKSKLEREQKILIQ